MLGGVLLPPFHAGADGGGGGVEDRHPVLLHHLPPGVLIREVRRALVHDRGGAVGHRAVDDVRVPGDPANVGGAPEHVPLGVEVEDHRGRRGHSGEVAAGGVHDALRLGGGSGGIQQEQRMFGLHRLGLAFRLGLLKQFVVPVVTAVPHVARRARRPDDDHRLQCVQPVDRLVQGLLDRGGLAAAARAVGGDERPGLRGGHPLLHGGRREAAEHHVVRRPDPGAGEHRHHDLGNHRQVDAYDVTLPHPLGLQRVRQALGVREDLGVGQGTLFTLLPLPVERDPVAVPGVHVPVQAVVGGVELAVGEPGVEGRVAVVEDRLERGLPVQPLPCLPRPPGRGVAGGVGVDGRIGHFGPRGEIGRRRERPDFQQLCEPFGRCGCLGRCRHG
jgi:hypothetical protein